MKQQDFLLLGIDHLVNTFNFVRLRKPRASFSIVTIVVDSGYEGIQSSFNNFDDFCSIARVPGYVVTNKHDADQVIGGHFLRPGFRIIGVSQRLFKTDLLYVENDIITDEKNEIFKYKSGSDITIVCFNFSFPQGLKLHTELAEKGFAASLFSVSATTPIDWSFILSELNHDSKLIILDDSKCVNRSCYQLGNGAFQRCHPSQVVFCTREFTDEDLHPDSEEFIVDANAVANQIT
jgi:pyruvate/2-oxoglutarate/acetoin dehydrogenase E1 component